MLCDNRRYAIVLSWKSRNMQVFAQVKYTLICAIAIRDADAVPLHQLWSTSRFDGLPRLVGMLVRADR